MLIRIVGAVATLILVGLACLLLGALLDWMGTKVPPAGIVGAFLITWAWIIGLAAALLYFASGLSWWPKRTA
jgi:hypothetical protein